jgi:hypothetical protein
VNARQKSRLVQMKKAPTKKCRAVRSSAAPERVTKTPVALEPLTKAFIRPARMRDEGLKI